ncbi:DEAD/DEAH box helicase [Lentzea sp. JNUCC 0626]|uniref:DEAD/DEAH box helicase n=1 Tax=Lentzea sp. JNUCC 0626 TaxID=3367513 RepID=UPI003749D111
MDLECVVRTTATAPYTDRRIFQIGAIRMGRDVTWVDEEPAFSRFVCLPEGHDGIRSPKVRALQEASAVSPAEALIALQQYCSGADVIVSYNGTESDFPALEEAFDREQLPRLEQAKIDAYYLALALWPSAKSHRLAALADALGVEREGLNWHDAVDDCVLLARLMDYAGRVVASWEPGLLDLVASVCPDSTAWTLVRQLAARTDVAVHGQVMGKTSVHLYADVAHLMSTHLSVQPPRRAQVGWERPCTSIEVGRQLRGADGRVDPVLLAAVSHGNAATRRSAQEAMTSALHVWADEGKPALIEAPTGTGKSFAVLAAALDWLAGGKERTAIITTFTKQLQQQLADDVVKLNEVVPGLLNASDLVKGQLNRLSLRALVVALADATALGEQRSPRLRNQNRFLERPLFREVLVYLVLRLVAAHDVRSRWTAHSVDAVDMPAFFAGYAGPALAVWLESLSQAANGEYAANAESAVSSHTDTVREALSSHRLLLANHALLLAHIDDLDALGPDTLLVVDEAHQLEDAATAALTTSVDYRSVEDLLAELQSWVGGARPGKDRESVREAVDNLEALLDHEHLPKVASTAFDAKGTGAGVVVGARTVTLTSSYTGTAGVIEVRRLAGLLMRLAGQCEALVGAFAAYRKTHESGADFFEFERVKALLARCAEVRDAAHSIVSDMNAVVGAVGTAAPDADGPSADLTGPLPDGGDQVDDADVGYDEDEVPFDEAEDEDVTEPPLGELPPNVSNRVVYAEELGALREGLRRYQFGISSSPVELAADSSWQQFLATFARTYYVSATLRVAGRWDFIRTRLGLPAGIATLALNTPFDLGRQAELVCLSDFPSWAEQAEAASRTVAHQLAGYAREVVRPVMSDSEGSCDLRGGYDGGALVLTTARSTAGSIADHLAGELRRRGDETPVLSTLVLGNHRGYQQFKDVEHGGGFLVGTKGLWQGVDIPDERRLRLVWINKLPFAPFAAPVIEARREAVKARAEAAHVDDPDAVATQTYYLPLAALQLRQAVGRLIRSERHRGVIVISDRKLAGRTALRRSYRETFLGSLDDGPDGAQGLLKADPVTGERAGGNVVPMAEGWTRIWRFLADQGLLTQERAAQLCTAEALHEHTLLPQTRRIRELALTREQVERRREEGTLEAEVLRRAAVVGGLLQLSDEPARLKSSQEAVIAAVASGVNVLGLLPTGFGKSFCFQLPALVLPGVTLVVSPLVALMHDQALELNRSIGGAVRALVAPMRESSSRAGKTEVSDQLLGRHDHGIRMVYVSPERLCQRRFREVVRKAVADGTVSRIVLDEAHTFVQWDDFRPSMSRVERFLDELREGFGLPVTALTATANRSVHTGLREGVFGLSANPPGGPAGEDLEARSGVLVTVRENPIRPELAIFRRTLRRDNGTVAGLAEEVLGAIDDHAIFYCLTVKEVVSLHAHLREYLGEAGIRVRRFHGRLTEAEKSSVMTEFREAPARGQEGFAPLVVVATSAFGLGINRPDVRTVFCVSAPTDLSALYQQLGRGGRDAAGKGRVPGPPPAEDGSARGVSTEDRAVTANVGLALMTTRGIRTVAFMTCQDLRPALLQDMGRAVLACDAVLDTHDIADRLIGADLAGGMLNRDEASKSRTAEQYQAGVVRVFAALAGLGWVEDLGDFPPLCAVKPGELFHQGGTSKPDQRSIGAMDQMDTESEVVAAVLALSARKGRGDGLYRSRLDVVRLDAHLAQSIPHFRNLSEDPPSTWHLLADLHDRGLLDVSAAPAGRLVTGLRVLSTELPPGFLSALSGKAARAREEIALLKDFYEDATTCANRKFADYFGVTELPAGCCSNEGNRCSACWGAGDWPIGERQPRTAERLMTDRPRPAGRRVDAAYRKRRLDQQVSRLVWEVFNGVHERDVHRALRGEDSYYHPVFRRRVRLRSGLVTSRFFGAGPALTVQEIVESLGRLEAAGTVVRTGILWRDAGHVRREQAKAARAAAQLAVFDVKVEGSGTHADRRSGR